MGTFGSIEAQDAPCGTGSAPSQSPVNCWGDPRPGQPMAPSLAGSLPPTLSFLLWKGRREGGTGGPVNDFLKMPFFTLPSALPRAPQPPSLWSAPPCLPSGSCSVPPWKRTPTWALSDSLGLCLPKTPAGSLCLSERRNNSEEAGSVSEPSLGRSEETAGAPQSGWCCLPGSRELEQRPGRRRGGTTA